MKTLKISLCSWPDSKCHRYILHQMGCLLHCLKRIHSQSPIYICIYLYIYMRSFCQLVQIQQQFLLLEYMYIVLLLKLKYLFSRTAPIISKMLFVSASFFFFFPIQLPRFPVLCIHLFIQTYNPKYVHCLQINV